MKIVRFSMITCYKYWWSLAKCTTSAPWIADSLSHCNRLTPPHLYTVPTIRRYSLNTSVNRRFQYPSSLLNTPSKMLVFTWVTYCRGLSVFIILFRRAIRRRRRVRRQNLKKGDILCCFREHMYIIGLYAIYICNANFVTITAITTTHVFMAVQLLFLGVHK